MQMHSVEAMHLTLSARNGIKYAGMSLKDAWSVIQKLTMSHFYKSMTVHADNRVWQDVYHASHKGKAFYIKFQRHDEHFVVSFKERDDE